MIITNNEEALRIKCEDVLAEEVGPLIEILEKELDRANYYGRGGIGLAAPQIGIAKNIAIIRLDKNRGYDLNLVNAKLTKGFDPIIFRQEGCLSFPGRVEDTNRFQEVYITDNLVAPNNLIVTGLMAIVCQHEIDHLNGVIFTDHIIKKATPVVNKNKVGPNNPCICGSNIKYKKCCGKNK
jgi:peptide deformylase